MEIRAWYIPENPARRFLLKLFNVRVPAGTRAFRTHQHIHFEIALFRAGAGTYTTAHTAYPIRPGDVFVFASNEVHCITEITAPLDLMNVHFEPRFLWSGSGSAAPGSELLCYAHNPEFSNRLNPDTPAADRIRALLRETERELTDRAPEYETMVRVKLSEIFVRLLRGCAYGDALPVNQTQLRHLDAIRRATDNISEHLTEPLTLAEIAAQAQMSPNYFSAVFRAVRAIPLWDYVSEQRVAEAMRRIDAGTESMLTVAMQSGFNNTANFNKTFRRYTGRTPSEYRRHGSAILY